MDKASDSGSEDWGFESLCGRFTLFFMGDLNIVLGWVIFWFVILTTSLYVLCVKTKNE